MKYSIKKQFTIIFVALMAGTIILNWILSNSFLESYYINNKTKVLLTVYDKINQAAEKNEIGSDEFVEEFQEISNTFNINMIILDNEAKMLYATDNDISRLSKILSDKIFMVTPEQIDEVEALFNGQKNYIIHRTTDPGMRNDYIEMWGFLNNGNLFLIRTAVESIRESVEIANRLMLYIGGLTILVSAFIIWIVTSKLTKPINALAKISERMIQLDFNAKYTGKANNEVALLGENINTLSKTLEKTISELKTANIELQKDLEKKIEIDEMRKEFLSNVSHELKTPIALIQGYAEGLKEGIHDDTEGKDFYCEVIMDEAAKMNSLVKKLLTLNQLESGVDQINIERFDLTDLIKGCLNSTSILRKQKAITTIFDSEEAVYVWADEFKVEEVIMNFLTNAIHHVSNEMLIEVKIIRMEHVVRVTVFNSGQLMEDNELPRIWEKFYKVDKARTREYGGSGIGLSIVKAIMESMNQRYGVYNVDNGVVFYFELELDYHE